MDETNRCVESKRNVETEKTMTRSRETSTKKLHSDIATLQYKTICEKNMSDYLVFNPRADEIIIKQIKNISICIVDKNRHNSGNVG